MAGKTPASAVDAYLRPLRRAISCVTNRVLLAEKPRLDTLQATTLAGQVARLKGAERLSLEVQQNFAVVAAADPLGPYKVTTKRYSYTLSKDDHEVVAFHWHPGIEGVDRPYIHFGEGDPESLSRKLHVPSGRVALEDVLWFAISQLGAEPIRPDWQRVFDRGRVAFQRYRSWG